MSLKKKRFLLGFDCAQLVTSYISQNMSIKICAKMYLLMDMNNPILLKRE